VCFDRSVFLKRRQCIWQTEQEEEGSRENGEEEEGEEEGRGR